jgi:uncharacterized protein (DUF3820 family)
MKLTDTSLMPYGKHKDIEMANVPASYLLWLYESKLKTDSKINMSLNNKMLKDYILDNLEILENEQADYYYKKGIDSLNQRKK